MSVTDVQETCARNLHQIFDAVQEHQKEHVLFRARNLHDCTRNLHKKNLAANRYDRHARFLYKFLVRVSPALRSEVGLGLGSELRSSVV